MKTNQDLNTNKREKKEFYNKISDKKENEKGPVINANEEVEKNKYNSEFEERDQKQNIGQIGDTYPPDAKEPEKEDLEEMNSSNIALNINDEEFLNKPNDSIKNKVTIDSNRHEEVSDADNHEKDS